MGRTKTKRATVKSQTLIINRETGKTLRKLTPASWQEIVAVNLDFNEHVIQTKKDILEFIKNDKNTDLFILFMFSTVNFNILYYTTFWDFFRNF